MNENTSYSSITKVSNCCVCVLR